MESGDRDDVALIPSTRAQRSLRSVVIAALAMSLLVLFGLSMNGSGMIPDNKAKEESVPTEEDSVPTEEGSVPTEEGSGPTDEEIQQFHDFINTYSKTYEDHEKEHRKNIFFNNLRTIRNHNNEAAAGKHTYTLDVNLFSDMTKEEFREIYAMKVKLHKRRHNKMLHAKDASTPVPTASASPTPTASISPTSTSSTSPSRTATASPSRTATTSPSSTASTSPTRTSTASTSPTSTASTSPSRTATISPTSTASTSPSSTATTSPSRTPTTSPTSTASTSPSRTATASRTPTRTPSTSPSLSIVYCPATECPTVDWVAAGAVTPVKYQGYCGCCWIFAAVSAIESAWFIRTNSLVSFSEQQVMNCLNDPNPCNGGDPGDALTFALNCQNTGNCFSDNLWWQTPGYVTGQSMCTETEVPFKAKIANCTNCTGIGQISNWWYVKADPQSMMEAVDHGPVTVLINSEPIMYYKSGVFSGNCTDSLDHVVTVVGYGTLNGIDFWKIKNSWGQGWGMNGFLLLARGSNGGNECGILEYSMTLDFNVNSIPSYVDLHAN